MKKIFALVLHILGLSFTFNAQTPMELLRGAEGMTPVKYHELSQQADGLFQRREYAKAVETYEQVTKAYPFDGEIWRRLGVARLQTEQFVAAAQAFVKADELGVTPYPTTNAINAARAYARAGEVDNALKWLEKAVIVYRSERATSLAQDTNFVSLRQNPRFQALVGIPSNRTFTRDDGWRYDLEYLISQIKRANATYSREPFPDRMDQAIGQLRKQIPKLSDAQIAVELQRIIAMMGHSHNRIKFEAQPSKFKFVQLPIRVSLFPEGVYVVAADSAHEDLIGAQITHYDATPSEAVVKSIYPLFPSEGEPLRIEGPYLMSRPQILHALGVINDPNKVKLKVIDRAGSKREVEVTAATETNLETLTISRPSATALTPLYLSKGDDFHWFEHLSKENAVYACFKQVLHKPDQTIAEFGLKLRRFLNEHHGVKNLIVDIRRNGGGDTYFYPELLRTIIAFDAREGNQTFVIIGRNTSSAAMNFALDLERMTNATFIGEPTMARPKMNGDSGSFILPWSNMQITYSTVVWQLTSPRDERNWIVPDVPVVLTAAAYFANRDPVMETIISLINRKN